MELRAAWEEACRREPCLRALREREEVADSLAASAAARARHPLHHPIGHCPPHRPLAIEISADDGQGSCADFTRGLAAAVEKRGVRILLNTKVVSLMTDANGPKKVTGVRVTSSHLHRRGGSPPAAPRSTEATSTTEIRAAAVVLCAGIHTPSLASTAGVYPPIQPLRGYSLTAPVTSAQRELSPRCVMAFEGGLHVTAFGDLLRFSAFGGAHPRRALSFHSHPGSPPAGRAHRDGADAEARLRRPARHRRATGPPPPARRTAAAPRLFALRVGACDRVGRQPAAHPGLLPHRWPRAPRPLPQRGALLQRVARCCAHCSCTRRSDGGRC